ncbi:hypothetical protein VTL71DRAFT_6107 [Oculimacula yallundae]|uniref:Uncharacterized protein n=1 Tax=Oculimacula yallundae TaxID=86028 RepID=A0ABR4BZI5_9HELO
MMSLFSPKSLLQIDMGGMKLRAGQFVGNNGTSARESPSPQGLPYAQVDYTLRLLSTFQPGLTCSTAEEHHM